MAKSLKVRAKSGKAKTKARKSVKRVKAKSSRKAKGSAKKRALPGKGIESTLKKIGEVTHYFPHVKAAAVKILKDGLKVGDEIYIKGHTTDFKERIVSIQLDHLPINESKKGQEIGLLVKSRVRIGDNVYRI